MWGILRWNYINIFHVCWNEDTIESFQNSLLLYFVPFLELSITVTINVNVFQIEREYWAEWRPCKRLLIRSWLLACTLCSCGAPPRLGGPLSAWSSYIVGGPFAPKHPWLMIIHPLALIPLRSLLPFVRPLSLLSLRSSIILPRQAHSYSPLGSSGSFFDLPLPNIFFFFSFLFFFDTAYSILINSSLASNQPRQPFFISSQLMISSIPFKTFRNWTFIPNLYSILIVWLTFFI